MNEGNIIFQQGTSESRQRKNYEDFLERDIFATRYVDNASLHRFGIYHSIYYLFESVGLLSFMERRDHTYQHLMWNMNILLINSQNCYTFLTGKMSCGRHL